MLASALFINYVDRGALPTAAHLIQDDLHFRETQLGLLMSLFSVSYTLAQIPVGWLSERYGAYRVLGAGVAIWACATLLMGFATSFAELFALRLLLGVGESPAFPGSSKLLAVTVPVEKLGKANGWLAVGYLLGPAFGAYIGGKVMALYGWRVAFIMFGALTLLWLIPWSRTRIDEPTGTRSVDPANMPSVWMLLRQRALWGAGIGHFAANYTFYFMIAWLPFYLVRERGFDTVGMATVVGVAFLLNAVGALLAGWAIDKWIGQGRSGNFAYKFSMALSSGGAIVCMLAIAFGDKPTALVAIYASQFLCGVGCPGVFAISQIFAGGPATGRWVGIQNCMGNLSGIIGPWLTGWMVETTGHFQSAFVVAAGVASLGIVGWNLMLPKIAPIQWRYPGAESAAPEPTESLA